MGVIVDPSMTARCPVVMFSTEGGMDIEAVPADKIAQTKVDVLRGFRLYDALNLAVQLQVPTKLLPAIGQAIVGSLPDLQELPLQDRRDQPSRAHEGRAS